MSDLDKSAKPKETEISMAIAFGNATFGDKEMPVFISNDGVFASSEGVQNLREAIANGYNLSNGVVYIVLPEDDYITIYNESMNNKSENNESEEINND